jgi:hypothetical protein
MDKLDKLYSLYLSKGLITEATPIDKFKSASDQQRAKLYELGKTSGLFATTDLNTFSSAWGGLSVDKKKEESALPSREEGTSLATQKMAGPKPLASSVTASAKNPLGRPATTPETTQETPRYTPFAQAVQQKPISKAKTPEAQKIEKEIALGNAKKDLFKDAVVNTNDLVTVQDRGISKSRDFDAVSRKAGMLQQKYGDLGFTFKPNESSFVGEDISVVADDGSSVGINLFSTKDQADPEAKKLQAFLFSRSGGNEKRKLTPQETLIYASGDGYENISKQAYDRIFTDENIKKGLNFLSEESFAKAESIKSAKAELESMQIELDKLSTSNPEEYNRKLDDYNSKIKIYNSKINDLKASANVADNAVKKVMAERLKREAEKGNWASAMYNAFVNGGESLAKGAMYALYEGEDILRSSIGLMDLQDKLNKENQEKAVNKIISLYANELKARGVSEEYLRSGSWAKQALFSLPETIPLMLISGPFSVLTMTVQGLGRRMDEYENNPEMQAAMPREEAFLLNSMKSLVEAKLENVGMTQALSRSGLANSLLIKSLQKWSPSMGNKALSAIVNAEVNSVAAKIGLNSAGAFIAEFETGGLQNIMETGFNELYNVAKENQVFKQPKAFTEEWFDNLAKDATMEGLGGLWMGGAANVAKYTYEGVLGKVIDNEQFKIVKNMLKDGVTYDAMVMDLKSKIVKGEISTEEAQNQMSMFKNAQSIVEQMPDDISIDQQRKAYDLITERKKLEREIAGKDPNLVSKKKNRINEINNQLKSISENAVQEQTTSEVPIQPEAGVGEEVAQGEPQAGVEVATEEGVQEEIGPGEGTVDNAIAADYLLTGGFNTILSTDYLLRGISGVFAKAGASIDKIRNKYAKELAEKNIVDVEKFIGTDTYNSIISEIREAISKSYNGNTEAQKILDDVLSNPTGMPQRLGFEIESRIDRLVEQINTQEGQAQAKKVKVFELDGKKYEVTDESTIDLETGNIVPIDLATQINEQGTLLETRPIQIEEATPESYVQELMDTKASDPKQYWSVDAVTEEAAREGTIVSDKDGAALVSKDGDIKGLFKKASSKAKGIAQKLLEKAVQAGGIKLDNFDTYLSPIYKKAGFRVVSRVPFNEQYAPEGWNKEDHGTPDVVAMVYDPNNLLDIEEKRFDDYDEAMAYRDSFVEQAKKQKEQKVQQPVAQTIQETDENYQESRDAVMQIAQEQKEFVPGDAVLEQVTTDDKGNVTGGVVTFLDADRNPTIKTISRAQTAPAKTGIVENVKKAISKLFPKLEAKNFNSAAEMREYARSKYGDAVADQVQDDDAARVLLDQNNEPIAILINDQLSDETTLPHEAWHPIMLKAFGDNQKLFSQFRAQIKKALIDNGFKDIADQLDAFANQEEYKKTGVDAEEWLVQFGALLTNKKIDASKLTPKQKSLIEKLRDIINSFMSKVSGQPVFNETSSAKDILDFMASIADSMAKGEDISSIVESQEGSVIGPDNVTINTRAAKKKTFKNNKYEVKQEIYNPTDGKATGFTFIADRMATGVWTGLNPKSGINIPLMGGIGYPMMKKIFKKGAWAVDGGSVMSSFLNKIVKSKTGIGFPVVMSEYSHVSNLTFAKIFEAEMNWMVQSGQITAEEQLKNVNEFISGSLIAKKDLSPKMKKDPKTGLMVDKNANAPLRVFTTEKKGKYTPKTYQSMDEVYNELETTFAARALFMQSVIGAGVKNRYAKIDKYKFPDMVKVADEVADPRLKGVPSGSSVSAIQFDQKKAKEFVEDIGSNKNLKEFHSAGAVGVEPHMSYEYVVEGESLGWLPGVIDMSTAEGMDEDTKEWFDEQRRKYKTGEISEAQLRSNVTAKARASMPEVTIKTKAQKAPKYVPESVYKYLTEDADGNIVFHHYSQARINEIRPSTGSGSFLTSREEQQALSSVGGLGMYYTQQGQVERGVGDVRHTVVVPKEKIYYMTSDPLNLYDEARARFLDYMNRNNDVQIEYAFNPNYQTAWITKVAQEKGFDMVISKWKNDADYRAQSSIALKPIEEDLPMKDIEDNIEVGDRVFVSGAPAIITSIDENGLATYKQKNSSGKFDIELGKRTDRYGKMTLLDKGPFEMTEDGEIIPASITTRGQKASRERMMSELDGVIAKSKERKATKETVYNNALAYLQGSKVYEEADDVERESLVRELRKKLGLKEKSVSRIFSLKRKDNGITVNERIALREQIRLEAKAAKDAIQARQKIGAMIKDQLSGMFKKGIIKTAQLQAINRKLLQLNFFNQDHVENFINYMDKVFRDAEYADKLSKANALQARIKRSVKDKTIQAETRDTAKEFSKLAPYLATDIDAYIAAAEEVYEAVQQTKGTVTDGIASVTFKKAMNYERVQEYTKNEAAAQEEARKQQLIEKNKYLLEAGVLDESMSLKEMMSIIASIEADPGSEAAKDKQKIIRDYVNKYFDSYRTILEEIIRTDIDPFTGERMYLTDAQRTQIGKFLAVDLNVLSLKDAYNMVNAIDNFVMNQNTDGMEATIAAYEGKKNNIEAQKRNLIARPLRAFWIKKLGNLWGEQFEQITMMHERMFGGVQRAIEFDRLSGLSKLLTDKVKALKSFNAIVESYANKFGKVKDFNKAENVFERGMLGIVSRNVQGSETEQQEEFNKQKKNIEISIKAMEKGTDKQKKEAVVARKVYDKILKDSNSYQDAKKKAGKENVMAVEFWQGQFANIFDSLQDVSRGVYNTILDRDVNYLPHTYKRFGKTEDKTDISEEGSAFMGINEGFDTKETGVLMKATKPRLTETDTPSRILSFDFDTNMSRAIQGALIDINTASTIRQISSFYSSEGLEKIIPRTEDRIMAIRRMKSFIKKVKKKDYVQEDSFDTLAKAANYISSFSASRALGSISQIPKQTISVAANTMINTGGSISIFDVFKAKDFIDNSGYGISIRGIASQADIQSINQILKKAEESKGKQALDYLKKLNDMYLELFVASPDVYIARASWLAYYKKKLKSLGVDTENIDWSTHEINTEAGDYAQRMTDRQQNFSDSDLAGEIMSNKKPIVQLLRKSLFPFASFGINKKAQLMGDMSVLYNPLSSSDDKKAAVASLASWGVEMAVYSGVSIFIGNVVYNFIANLMADYEEDEEEKEKKYTKAIQYRTKNAVVELLSPIPNVADDALVDGINFTLNSVGVDEQFRLPEGKGEKLYEKVGLTNIMQQKMANLSRMTYAGATGTYVDKFGNEKEMSKEDQQRVASMAAVYAFYAFGFVPADFGTTIDNAYYKIGRKSKKAGSGGGKSAFGSIDTKIK